MEKLAYFQMAETEQRHWWFSGRRTILERMLLHHLPVEGPRHILEIGAGTGGNLAMLRNFGALSATEMDKDARQIARGRSGIEVLPGSLPDELPRFPRKFELVCLFDVLEHVDDDAGSLAAICKLMALEGLLLLTVPAYPWLWSTHDEIFHHKRRYTRKSLHAVIISAGLRARRLCYFNTFLFPAAVLGKIIDRLRTGESSSGTDMPPPALNTILTRIFAMEAGLLTHFDLPFGVSLLALLERH